ncbi:type III restriction endonuclease subunit M [Mycoplasma sp. CSL7503-lung]|uniref:type III restriction endonuclease subunit M n=1 Tax=Mycoplasma sp. CSL7503-lung TaxID=536372 RepID=UPI0021CF0E2D|nr:type III restriction endonuclease subunit M [Mycoplasma sp. CSL7503-lung]MCU4706922.1 type III restriction endonuclease subunit M [Mycoplasma sp. CSL7503-lung]
MENKHYSQLLEDYKNKIDELSINDLNNDQKAICKTILENLLDKTQLQNVYQFLMQRVKIGFTFDSAPEINSKTISVLKHNNEKSFRFNESKSENNLIIGENYDALKNLLVIERERERESRLRL